ncbi:MAG: phytoene desaturase family protein [Candidatus Firestonebacteria bacterium]|nr:phytoene desaturase family protein [Candidatus Firestonebacteria bacterium]
MSGKCIVIVGAGPGGLSAGMILAKRGFKVTILEKEAVAGGRNAPLKKDGYTFDIGPTFLMMNYILKEIFEESGKKAEDYIKVQRLDPMYRLKFTDKDIIISSGFEEMKAEIEKHFPGNTDALRKFMETEKKRYGNMFPCLQKEYTKPWHLLRPVFLKAIPSLQLHKTFWQNLSSYFKQDDLKICFTFQAKYIGMSPWECPAAFTMIPYVEHEYGIYHVTGGLNQISAGMARAFKELGGELLLNTEVEKLLMEKKKVKGVRIKGGKEVFADEVIVNADFAYAMSSLAKNAGLKKYSLNKLKKKRYSCSTFMLYLGVKKKYNIPHHNIVFAGSYRKNVEEIFQKGAPSEDMSAYVQNASVTDSTLAPEGKSTIYILVPCPNKAATGNDWEKIKESYKNKVLDMLEKRTELKDLRANIETEIIYTPDDWEKKHNVFYGATFNLAHNLSQMLYSRPRNKFEELDNCYLVGGGTHPGSGLPTIYESARITSNLISKKYGVPFIYPTTLNKKESF